MRLRADEAETLDSLLGSGNSVLAGELLSKDDGGLLLYVPTGTRQVGFHQQTLKQRVRIPAGGVLELQRRQLDRGRTAVALAGIGLSVGIVVVNALSGQAGGNTVAPPPGGPSQAIAPALLGVPILMLRP